MRKNFSSFVHMNILIERKSDNFVTTHYLTFVYLIKFKELPIK